MLLTLALAPLGSIAVYSEFQGWQAQEKAAQDAMLARTIDSVSGPRALLDSAMVSAMRLGAEAAARIEDTTACSAYLAEYIARSGFYSFAGFIDAQGQMRCSSTSDFIDFAASPDFQHALDHPVPSFSFQPDGAVSRRAVVIANRPVFDGDNLLGFMSVSIGRDRFDAISPPLSVDASDKITYLINARGDALTRYDAPEQRGLLPDADLLADLIATPQRTLRAQSAGGQKRVFVLAELTNGQLYALSSLDPDQAVPAQNVPYWQLGFPVLMWLASIAVVMLAMHYLVVRHLRQINGELRRFALGNRDGFRRLPDDAPRELREIDTTFTKMALLIRRDEIEQEDALREKTVLLKEVHHRVKNNLQMIASILNLQIRRLTDPEARAILQGVQGRVRSLATIHRTFYEQKQGSDSYAKGFFETVLKETLALAQSDMQELDVETAFEVVDVPHEKIIPAALLFSEALSNALKYALPVRPGAPAELLVTCCNRDGDAELRVRNSLPEDAPVPDSSGGLGHELMTAFALQISADLQIGPVQDTRGPGWEMRLRLPISPGPSERAALTGRAL
ncbi:MAG: sensor histidine kinase [Rhodobacteraceae bacterium]|nr:MAG: sensor histidine kinase [Paracoccaceae bacterium]